MNYKYFDDRNYEDFACGRVIYHKSGYPNFPVRLAGEIFMNCLEVIHKLNEKVVLYDPCCGGGYLLTVLGYICGDNIESIYGSDISIDAVKLAKENLNLLTKQGLNYRKKQLEKMYNEYGKRSHLDAIVSTDKLLEQLSFKNAAIDCSVFSADIMNKNALAGTMFKADIIFTDVPYGNLVSWSENNSFAIDALLTTVIPVLNENAVIAICSDKSQKISNPQFKRIRKILIGKRKIELLQKVS